MRYRLALALAIAAGLLIAPMSASAAFHLMKISEAHDGGAAGDYVELQMHSSGQSFVSGRFIQFYDSIGAPLGAAFQFPTNVANGENQRTILVGSPIGATPDFLVPGKISSPDLAARCASSARCQPRGSIAPRSEQVPRHQWGSRPRLVPRCWSPVVRWEASQPASRSTERLSPTARPCSKPLMTRTTAQPTSRLGRQRQGPASRSCSQTSARET